jgi:hypothetical protein
MKKLSTILLAATLAALIAASAFAAIADNAGTSAGDFLRLPAGAKPSGMGEAYAALADDVYSLYFNPAGLACVAQKQALLSHTMYFVDVNHDYAAYAMPFAKGGIGASISYLSTTFDKRTANNTTDTPDSTGNINDMALSLGYAQPLMWGLNGGISLKYISSTLDNTTASSPALDLGLQKQITSKIKAGISVTNIGASLKYITDTVSVENTADLGIAEKGILLSDLTLSVDYKELLNMSGQTTNLGAEYLFNIAKDWAIDPRAGYISENDTMTAGLGISYKLYEFDYAFNTQSDLGTSNRMSVTVKF